MEALERALGRLLSYRATVTADDLLQYLVEHGLLLVDGDTISATGFQHVVQERDEIGEVLSKAVQWCSASAAAHTLPKSRAALLHSLEQLGARAADCRCLQGVRVACQGRALARGAGGHPCRRRAAAVRGGVCAQGEGEQP